MKKQLIVGVLIPVLIGGLMYVGLRSESLVMFSWFETLHIDGPANAFRSFIQNMDTSWLPHWAIYSLPGGLYMMSCVSLLNASMEKFFS